MNSREVSFPRWLPVVILSKRWEHVFHPHQTFCKSKWSRRGLKKRTTWGGRPDFPQEALWSGENHYRQALGFAHPPTIWVSYQPTYNIPFINFFPPPPWQPMLLMIQVQVQHSFYQFFPPPPWQPMLLMIQVQVQHSFYQFFPPPPLATHAFNDSGSSATFLLSIFPPPLATHAFNDSGSSATFLLSIFPPPLGNPCF